jgi:hypothetical protein
VLGHDLSRAERRSKRCWDLAPASIYFQLFGVPQRLKPESLNGPLAARLKSHPDTFNPLKVILQVALGIKFRPFLQPVYPQTQTVNLHNLCL